MKKDKTIRKFNIMAILLIILFCMAIAPVTLQNDTYYTIAIGKHITENGIDMQDPFSWHDLPYTYPHWGYDVFIYLIYAAFGMTGIYVSTCVLSAILGVSLYVVNCKLAKNHVISFVITLISMYLLKDYIAARAQLVTFILFVLTIYFIEKFLETKHKRYAIGLIIIPIMIANIHVAVWPFYFVLFLPYIGEYIIAVITDIIMDRKLTKFILQAKIKRLSKGTENEIKIAEIEAKLEKLNTKIEKAKIKRKQAKENPYKLKITRNNTTKWLIVIMIIAILTGLLTPLGDVPYTYLIKTMQGNTTQNINEHQPLTPINNEPILCLMIAYIAILTFTKTKINLKDLLMIGGLMLLMLYSKRQSTMVVIIGSVIINKMLLETLVMHFGADSELKLLKRLTNKVAILVIVALVWGISLHFLSENQGKTFVDAFEYPVEACDYILENIDVKNSRFYNDYNYGSYMLFRGIPVFIDSRADLYAPEFNTKTGNSADGKDIFMDFINVSGIATYYDTMFDKYEMTHIITTKNSKLAMLIKNRNDNKYKELNSESHFIIYEIQRDK